MRDISRLSSLGSPEVISFIDSCFFFWYTFFLESQVRMIFCYLVCDNMIFVFSGLKIILLTELSS